MSGGVISDGQARLIDVFIALGHNRLTAKDRQWLMALLWRLLSAEDVRDQFFTFKKRRRGERADEGAALWRAQACALYIATRSSRARADRITVAKAKFEAEAYSGMTEEQVRRAWLKHSALGRELAEQIREIPEADQRRLLALVREMPDFPHLSNRE